MLDSVFLQILNMSFTASFVIAFVLIARLLLKKVLKIFSYALWSVVLFRLVCPFSIESAWSLLPINTTLVSSDIIYSQTPQIDTGLAIINETVNPMLPTPTTGASINPLQIWTLVGEIVWLAGIAGLLLYSMVSLFRLRSKLIGAVKLRDNIYLADHIATPFVMGVLRPKIYLPSTLSENEQKYIILHEQTHIRRFDYIVKIIAFLALCVHWFNPFVWLAFILCAKDMEMSCDESVMRQMNTDIRGEYSASLLSLATGRKIIAGTPLAFGEGDTKARIKNVVNYKKPTFWVIIVALTAIVIVCIGLVSNPLKYGKMSSVVDEYPPTSVAVLSKVEIITPHETVRIDDREQIQEIFDYVSALDVSRKEVGLRGGGDALHQIVFYDVEYPYNNSFKVNINDDFSEVWIDNNVKPSLIHQIKAPELIKDYLYSYLEGGIIAVSGKNRVPVVVYQDPLDVSLSDIKDSIYFLDIAAADDDYVPFRIYSDGNEQFGSYRIYDAETLEELNFTQPSGLEPQTYILSETQSGHSYIITLSTGDTLVFGINIP